MSLNLEEVPDFKQFLILATSVVVRRCFFTEASLHGGTPLRQEKYEHKYLLIYFFSFFFSCWLCSAAHSAELSLSESFTQQDNVVINLQGIGDKCCVGDLWTISL